MTIPDPVTVVARLRRVGCVFAEDEAALLIQTAGSGADLEYLVGQRESGRPLEYVLGWAAFGGLRIPVTDGVFVPRRRSELLARLATQAARQRAIGPTPAVVLDLCCGAGALGAVIADGADIELHSVDIDPAAVRCAARATAEHGGRVYLGDLFDPLPGALRGRVDVLVANAPYVPTSEIDFMPVDARGYERRAALDGGGDGLAVLRRVVAGAPGWLVADGIVLMECAEHQVASVIDAVTTAGLHPDVVHDEGVDATVVLGARAPGSQRLELPGVQ